jgi:hypothetical protein
MLLPTDRKKRHTKLVAMVMKIEQEVGRINHRVYRHSWIRDTYKSLSGCESCGFNTHSSALQFDHIDPSTKYRDRKGNLVSPSSMVNCSLQVMLHEFSKCQILCANCHAIHTHTVQRVPLSERDNLGLAA